MWKLKELQHLKVQIKLKRQRITSDTPGHVRHSWACPARLLRVPEPSGTVRDISIQAGKGTTGTSGRARHSRSRRA